MSLSLMSRSQQSMAAGIRLSLAEGKAMRLPATSAERWLQVTQGRVWLTATADKDHPVSADCWLTAGEHTSLKAGQDVVVEGWPHAHFHLLSQPPGRSVRSWRGVEVVVALGRWLRRLGRRPSAASSCANG